MSKISREVLRPESRYKLSTPFTCRHSHGYLKRYADHHKPLGKPVKTLVIVIGTLRGGEVVWESLYRNFLNESINPGVDLAVFTGYPIREEYQNSILLQMAKHVWFHPEYKN